jgi:transcriptional regulator with XRE-family HTH domain
MDTIGDVLRAWRKSQRLTLQQFADKIGMTLNTVYRWENNIAVPRYSALRKMATELDMRSRENVGTLIRIWRMKSGMSPAVFGAMLGVSGHTVHRWETGRSRPEGGNIFDILTGLKISTSGMESEKPELELMEIELFDGFRSLSLDSQRRVLGYLSGLIELETDES